ncbi:hypothetical protein ACOME3_002798 [Neoechinorhynchus agilis]
MKPLFLMVTLTCFVTIAGQIIYECLVLVKYREVYKAFLKWLYASVVGFATEGEDANSLSVGWTHFNRQFKCCGRGDGGASFVASVFGKIPQSCCAFLQGPNNTECSIASKSSYINMSCIEAFDSWMNDSSIDVKLVVLYNLCLLIQVRASVVI